MAIPTVQSEAQARFAEASTRTIPSIADLGTPAFRLPESAYVPSNRGPHPFGDVDGFRKAMTGEPGYYFAARVVPDFETPATPGRPSPSMVPGFDSSAFLVFRWDCEPKDGDIVLCRAITEEPTHWAFPALAWLCARSLRAERFANRFGWLDRQVSHREYLVRRFRPEKDVNVDEGSGFRLEMLDKSGADTRGSDKLILQICGVLTSHQPFGVHRDLAVC